MSAHVNRGRFFVCGGDGLHYDDWIVSIVTVSALASYAAIVMAVLAEHYGSPSTYCKPVLIWVVHVALYWTVNIIVRLFWGYEGPSAFFSAWAGIVQLHALISIVAILWIRIHQDRRMADRRRLDGGTADEP